MDFDISDRQLASFVQKWIPMTIMLLVIGFILFYYVKGADFSSAFSMNDIMSALSGLFLAPLVGA